MLGQNLGAVELARALERLLGSGGLKKPLANCTPRTGAHRVAYFTQRARRRFQLSSDLAGIPPADRHVGRQPPPFGRMLLQALSERVGRRLAAHAGHPKKEPFPGVG